MRGPGIRWAAGALVALVAALFAVAAFPARSGGPSERLGAGPPPGAPPTVATPPPSADGTGGQPAPAGEVFGANVNRLFESDAFDPAARDAQLAALRAAGATVARTDALWELSEPAPPQNGVHHYDWTFDDGIASALAKHGLRWLPVLDYTAGWDQSVPGVDHSPPATMADYADYAAAFASRYGPGGNFWNTHPALPDDPVDTVEIWNEPDNRAFWSPAADPVSYAYMYLQARAAIAARQPSIRVLVGGLWHPATFLGAMLAARPDLAGHVDGIAIHPYGSNPAGVAAGVRSDRGLLDRLGLAKVPLYVTEVGWTTSPPGALHYLPERQRPTYLADTLAGLGRLDCGLAATIVYTWVTEQGNPANSEQWYGISPPSGGRSADTDAFAAGVLAAQAPGRGLEPCTVG